MGGNAGGLPGKEDFEQFLEIRAHVQRMQSGTPLLLRRSRDGQEDLQICTFWVTKDLKALKWREQEGSGEVREVALTSIDTVAEESGQSGDSGEEDGHYALTVNLKANGQAQVPSTISLICASPEDLLAWRDGLKFLVGGGPVTSPTPASGKVSVTSSLQSSPSAAARQLRDTGAASQAAEELRRKLKEQVEANDKLTKENDALREVVKRKDVTIAELIRDLQNRSASATDRGSKTESTSRESDDHLRDREVTILQRKNRRLRKTLQEKQKTISELLKLVGQCTAAQGAESSAVEDGNEEEDEDSCAGAEMDDDGVGPNSSSQPPPTRSPAVVAVKSPARSPQSSPKPITGGGGGRAGALAASMLAEVGEPANESEEAAMEEVRMLAGQLERLERDLAGLSSPSAAAGAAAGAFKPPPRTTAAATSAAAGPRQSPTSAARSAPAAKASPKASPKAAQAGGMPAGLAEMLNQVAQAGGHGGMPAGLAEMLSQGAGAMLRGGPPSVPAPRNASAAVSAGVGNGQGSAAALQALEKEMAVLEEKKRVVEQLARKLEPPSDEEDDGFPLR